MIIQPQYPMTPLCIASSVRRAGLRALVAVAACILLQAIPAKGAYPSLAGPAIELRSPDERIAVIVNTEGRLTYRVFVEGVPVLGASQMGFLLREQGYLGADVTLVEASRSDVDTTWINPLGKHHEVRDLHRELKLTFARKGAGRPGVRGDLQGLQ